MEKPAPTLVGDDDKSQPALSNQLAWAGITYEIPIPSQSRKQKKSQIKSDVEAGVGVVQPSSTRRILDGLDGHVNSGEMVAILGASGAGKTTLLNILSSRLNSTGTLSGQVSFNGADRRQVNWKRMLGFVEQDDLLYGELTVTETLDYSAQLRLPTNKYTLAEKRARVEETIQTLRLEKCATSRIGDGVTRGISGGERKRVAIGQELVSDVGVLMLDEPTSGLDSFSALNLIQNLGEISKQRNVVCLMTIHQPSWEIFTNFTRVILMTRGQVFYDGPPRDTLDYFGTTLGMAIPSDINPSDWFLTISENYEKSDEGERRVENLINSWKTFQTKQAHQPILNNKPTPIEKEEWAVSWIHELALLSRRNYQQIARNPKIWIGSFAQNLVLLILIGFAFFRRRLDQGGAISRLGALFFIPINNSFSVLFPILTVFPIKRAMSVRERAAGMYRCSSFYLSNVIVEIPSQCAQRAFFLIVIYWMIGLKSQAGAFFLWLAVNFVQLLTAVGLGFLIGAGASNLQAANALAPLANVIFLLFGGNLLPLKDIPKYFIWLHWISPITYSFQALTLNEFSGLKFNCNTDGSSTQCYRTGEDVLGQYDLNRFSVAENIGFLCLISFIFGFLGYICLRTLGRPGRRFI